MHAGATTLPLHWSRVHGLPSLVQGKPAGSTTLVGQVPLVPEHVSAMSHSFAAALHTVPADLKVQFEVWQQAPAVHCGLLQLALAVDPY